MDILDQYYCPICSSSLIEEPVIQQKQKIKCSNKYCYYIHYRDVDDVNRISRFLKKLKVINKSNEFKDIELTTE